MSTLRVSNIEAKADVSSPSVNEKVKVTNSNGELLIHIDGATSGITTVGISTSGESFRFDSNQNVTFFGSVTGTGLDVNGNADISGNLNVGGVLTYEDVTSIDAVGLITARNGLQVTGGNVGINEASPDSKFHVNSGAETVPARFESTGTQSRIGFKASGTPTSYHVACGAEANNFIVYTNNTERVRISSTGQLHLNGATGKSTSGTSATDLLMANNAAIRFRKGDDSAWINSVGLDSNNNLKLGWGGSTSEIHFGISGIGDQMFLDSGGRLLLGTTTEGEANADDLTIATSAHTGMTIRSGTANRGNIYFSDGTSGDAEYRGYITYDHDGDKFSFATANYTRIKILGDGTIASGNLSSTPGTVAAGSIIQTAANAGFFSNGIDGKFGTASSHPLYFQTNGVTKATINTAGNMGVGISDPTQAKLVAQTASGMSIAAVKDNTGASISLGGVTQPRILMEAGASASQLKLYTASGSSYSSAGWRQRLHVTDTNASVASTGSGTNGIGCFGIADNIPDSRALALSIGGGNGLYGIEDPRPMVYLQRSYGVGGGSSTDETTLEINAPGSYNSAGVVYGIKSRVQHNLNGSHYAGHFEGHGSQYSANGTSALYAKTTKLDTNGMGDVIAFRADASINTGIANNGAAIAGYFASGNNINGKPIVCQNGYTTNSYSNQIIFRKHNGSSVVQVGSIRSNNTATQYNTSSDYRLKENIISLTGAIDRLKQLQPKRFNFIGIDETIDGFIAHEVNPVAPYAVSGEKDAVKKELVLDEDGKEQFDENGEIIIEEVIDPQSVDYSKLTTLTIAALQEALAKIETLEAAVAALQGS